MGWNGSDLNSSSIASNRRSGSSSSPHSNGVRNGLIALILIALIGGAAWWFLTTPASQPTPVPEEEETPAPVDESAKPKPPPKEVEELPPVKAEEKDPHEGMRLASNGVWMPKNRPYLAGRTKIFPVKTNSLQRFKGPHVARNATEGVIMSIFSRERGDMPLPLPRLPEKELKKIMQILTSPSPLSDTDTEDTLVAKEILETAKIEMADYVKKGGNPEDFLQYYHDELERSYQHRRTAQDYVNKLSRGEDSDNPALIKKIVDEYNEKLEAQGIRPLDYPVEVLKYNRELEAGHITEAPAVESAQVPEIPADEPTDNDPDGERDVAGDVETAAAADLESTEKTKEGKEEE